MAFNAWPADGAPEARDAVHSKLGEMHAGEGEKPCDRIMPARMGRPAKSRRFSTAWCGSRGSKSGIWRTNDRAHARVAQSEMQSSSQVTRNKTIRLDAGARLQILTRLQQKLNPEHEEPCVACQGRARGSRDVAFPLRDRLTEYESDLRWVNTFAIFILFRPDARTSRSFCSDASCV
jgi:hypothetical protein